MDGVPLAVELLASGVVLLAALAVGTVAHELSHALVLRAVGIELRIEWLPNRDRAGILRAAVLGTLAAVRPLETPDGGFWPTVGFRLAGVAPLALASPALLVLAGVVPNPFALGEILVEAAAAGWFASAIPSPRDVSLAWHGSERAVLDRSDSCEETGE